MIKNPLLAQSLANIEKGVQDRESFDRIVKAGTKVIYDKQMFESLIQGLNESDDPIKEVGEGMIGVLGLLYQKSRNTMPILPMVQAGMALLIDALDFMEQAGMAKVGPEELSKATSGYINDLLPKFGLTPDKVGGLLSQVKGTMDNPERMAQVQAGMKGKP